MAARVNRIDVVPRSRSSLTAARRRPFQVASRDSLAACPLEQDYDLVLLESELVAPILANPALRYGKLALRVHNDEASFSRNIAKCQANPLLKAFHWAESLRFPATSREVFERADQIWFICGDFHSRWSAAHPDTAGNSFWLPVPIDVADLRQAPLTSQRVIFIGNLVAATNIEAIEWYIANVHPGLRDIPGYHFSVVGSLIGRAFPPSLATHTSDPQLSFVTDAPDLGPHYQESSIFVNPMRHGASVKVKTIHAVANGLPVITTTVGNEGTGFQDGRHVLVRNSPSEFSRTLRELLLGGTDCRLELVTAAQAFLAARYDHPAQVSHLLASLIQKGDAAE